MDELRPLKGARIWLSGSLAPEFEGAAMASFETFVTDLSARIFRAGGTVVHGSHPSLVKPLLKAVKAYRDDDGSRECLLLAASKLFHADYAPSLADWQEQCLVHEEPAIDNDKSKSLKRLRLWMADRCDAMIGIGGKRWKENPGAAGVPEEFELARQRGLPCFLLGGLGGAAAGYLQARPEVVRNLRNGLDAAQNLALAAQQNVATLVTQVFDQLCRLPLVRGEPLGDSSFRILALDGGGIKGAFTAAVLATWEEQLEAKQQGRLTDYFDLVAGTSTGGILALGLGMGLRARDILDFYRTRGPTVFPVISVRDDPVLTFGAKVAKFFTRDLQGPQYDASVLQRELEAAFKNAPRKTLGEAVCCLVIPSVYARTGEVKLFCTDHHDEFADQAKLTATQVALATAAAPTYFRAANLDDSAYLDGGLWANNPALAAVAEAVGRLHVPLNRVDILSVGTTSEPYVGATRSTPAISAG